METLMESVWIALIVLILINLTLVGLTFIKETKPFIRPLIILTDGGISALAFVYGNWVAGTLYLFVGIIATIIVIDDLVFLSKLKEQFEANKQKTDAL